MRTAEGEARRALARLGRALEKAERELEELAGALRHAEGDDFPREAYDRIEAAIREGQAFVEEEAERLQRKVLQHGGLEPGRVRRSG